MHIRLRFLLPLLLALALVATAALGCGSSTTTTTVAAVTTAAAAPTTAAPADTNTTAAGQTATTASADSSKTAAIETTTSVASGPKLFTVTRADGSTKDFSMADGKALPQTSVVANGVAQNGPTLTTVLQAAGVTDFTSVSVTGSGTLTLKKADVTDKVVLDITKNRGTVKLAGPTIPKDNWVKDVSGIKVG